MENKKPERTKLTKEHFEMLDKSMATPMLAVMVMALPAQIIGETVIPCDATDEKLLNAMAEHGKQIVHTCEELRTAVSAYVSIHKNDFESTGMNLDFPARGDLFNGLN